MKMAILIGAALLALLTASYWVVPKLWVPLLIALDRSTNGVTLRETTVNGRRIAYWEAGSGEAVVMLHGFGGNKDHWTHFAGQLKDRYRLVAIDMPGFGDSPGSTSDKYDIASQTERILGVVQQLGLSKFHLIGNSMGAHVAARLAQQRPDMVQSVALLESHGLPPQGPTEFDAIIQSGKIPLVVSNEREFERMVQLIFVNRPWVPAPVYDFLREDAIFRATLNRHIWNESHGRDAQSLEEVLPAIKTRALVVWGDSNRVFHVDAVKTLQKHLPTARTVVLNDCGHLPMMERPEETAAAYRKFLSEAL